MALRLVTSVCGKRRPCHYIGGCNTSVGVRLKDLIVDMKSVGVERSAKVKDLRIYVLLPLLFSEFQAHGLKIWKDLITVLCTVVVMFGSCHLDRVFNDELSVECLF